MQSTIHKALPVKNKDELIFLIRENAVAIKEKGVQRLGIFGSFVRNDMTEKSDVDFLVEFEPGKTTYDNFITLAYFLEDICGRRIELLTKKGLSKYIGPKILKTTEYVALSA